MGFLKKYREPFKVRLYMQIATSLFLAGALSIREPVALLFWFCSFFLLLDLFLTRIDKIIKVMERK